MDALPQVGQKYQHKKWGEVIACYLNKRGRGYRVVYKILNPKGSLMLTEGSERLKDFQKATQ